MAAGLTVQQRKRIQPRLRIHLGEAIALGPGKIELLQHVRQTGSIAEAARLMNMSYMRAWTLIRTMNRSFVEPLVATTRGGTRGGGGAELTTTGLEVMRIYELMSDDCVTAIQTRWRRLRQLLR